MEKKLTSLEQILDAVKEAKGTDGQVRLEEILDRMGTRSYGPVILLAGLITLAPLIGDIPGVPTIMGILVFMTSVQMLLGQDRILLPRWVKNHSVGRSKIERAVEWLRKPARFIDRYTKARLSFLVRGPGFVMMALFCMSVALIMPILEFIPFSANGAGAALTAFGLALTTRDGLFGLIAFLIFGGAVTFVVSLIV
jgi:hypothetical protein